MKRMTFAALTCAGVFLTAEPIAAQPSAAWLAGCWTLQAKDRQVEENWTGAAAGVMLGVARTIAGDKMVEHEFVVLRPNGDKLEYAVRMNYQPMVVFTSTVVAKREITFENAAHDFPKRLGYKLASPDVLEAWIDGGANSKAPRIAYAYRRGTCTAR